MQCPLECSVVHEDTQENLLECSVLKTSIDTRGICYKDLFSDISMQSRAIKVFTQLLSTRKNTLKKIQDKKILTFS